MMKKLFFFAATLLCMCIGMNAQTKISFDGPYELEWKVKRCFVKGSNCIIDLVMTNTSNKNMKSTLYWFPDGGTTGIMVYDDEGSVYKYENISGNFGGTDFGSSNAYNVQIPSDIALKLRCQIRDFDEFAATVKLLKIPLYIGSDSYSKMCYLQVNNIPVYRE